MPEPLFMVFRLDSKDAKVSLVALFSAACFWPGLLLFKSGFSRFSDWIPKMQECVNLVDLVKSFLTSMYLHNLASIQPRVGLSKFAKN